VQLTEATILIVDDEEGLLGIYKGWFKREGCRVLTAANGAAALELAMKNRVDVILSDIRMPVMDGVELTKRLKETKKYIPKIIFISGFTDLDERETYDLGIEAKLSKPIRRQDLVSVVRKSLMVRDELWRSPPPIAPQKTLNDVFESLAAARDNGLIAFGRGGFSIHSLLAVQAGETIELRLEFKADRHTLAGRGIVRWTARHEEQIGVEITYVDEANRAWVVGLAEGGESVSFVPRTSRATVNIRP